MAGAAALPMLPGCTNIRWPWEQDDSKSGGPGRRESRTYHFDFSRAPLANLWLIAPTSKHDGASLSAHDDQSRARFREENEILASVPDEQLTHYIERIDMPADEIQILSVRGQHADTGAEVLAAHFLHIPLRSLDALSHKKRAEKRFWGPSPKMRAYNIKGSRFQSSTYSDVSSLVTAFDVGTALIFHCPDITSLDPDLAASLVDLIQNAPCDPNDDTCISISDVVIEAVANLWPASTDAGGWAQLVPLLDQDGNPALDNDGNQIYQYNFADDIKAALRASVPAIIRQVYNDPTFGPSATNPDGANYHPQPNPEATVVNGSSGSTSKTRHRSQTSGTFAISAQDREGQSKYGVKFLSIDVTDQNSRTISFTVRNAYLRYLKAFAQFFDAGGSALPPPSTADPNTSRATYLVDVSSNSTIMGIPLVGDDISSTSFEVSVPPDASSFDLMLCGLGVGGEAFAPESVDPSIETMVLNIFVPTIFMAAGVGSTISTYKGVWTQIPIDTLKEAMKAAIRGVQPGLAANLFGAGVSPSPAAFLSILANSALSILFSGAPAFAQFVIRQVLAQDAAEAAVKAACPILGFAIAVAQIVADAASIAECVAETCTSPAIYRNRVQLTMDTVVTINRDPDDFRFPAQATTYVLSATYDKAPPHTSGPQNFSQGTSEPLVYTFTDVPAGGKVQFDVKFFAADGTTILGQASSDLLDNSPTSTAAVSLTITESVIPLTGGTTYQHKQILSYNSTSNVREWVPRDTPPTATASALTTSGTTGLWGLNCITVAQRLGMVGYGYQAGAQNILTCRGNTAGILNVFQNLFLAQDNGGPDSGLISSPCGFAAPAGLVYTRKGDAGGQHFFIQPADDGFFDVRSATLNKATGAQFNMDQSLTWGRFTVSLDSLAIHPYNILVGVSRQTHTLQILQLASQAVAPNEAPAWASPSGSFGDLEGNLNTPVAVAVSDVNGAIYVLEQGNKRVQAFNSAGSIVNAFNSTAIFALKTETGTVTYLDLAIEGTGYFYVLSYTGDGSSALDYNLDVYQPNGIWLCRTNAFAAARLAVDTFRNLYALNYETLANPNTIEPTLSQWAPSVP